MDTRSIDVNDAEARFIQLDGKGGGDGEIIEWETRSKRFGFEAVRIPPEAPLEGLKKKDRREGEWNEEARKEGTATEVEARAGRRRFLVPMDYHILSGILNL